MTLRKKPFQKLDLLNEDEKDEPTDLIITTDLPFAFQCSTLAGEKKIVQFIKRPIITDPVANSKKFSSSHQRILNLKTIGEHMYNHNNNNNSMFSLNQNSILGDNEKQVLDPQDLNTQNELVTQPNEQIIDKQNYSLMNQSKFNLNTNNSLITNQNLNEMSKLSQNKTLMQSISKESLLPQLKQSQNQLKTSTMNQSEMSMMMNTTFQNANQLQQPFKSFRAYEYYNRRIEEVKELVKDFKTIYEQNVDYQGLAIIGESQLEREIEMVKRADEYTLFVKYCEDEEDNQNKEELF